ncbi:hypothetical protein CB1_000092014 [Camelus ferus]|nr:hypothetical protein CB1_002039003 [Camelus ferus]EPY89581.1 hypothetical protein CB1_000092014 [Camelus ferus]
MAAGPAGAAGSNGYTCSDCSLLSERQASLTACAAARGPSSRIYSRDRNQKRRSRSGGRAHGSLRRSEDGRLRVPGASLCAGISLRGRGDLLSLLPVLNWTHVYRTQRVDGPSHVLTPDTAHLQQPLEVGDEAFHWHRVNEAERQTASVSGQCHSHDQKLRELTASLQKLQARVDQMDVSAEGLLSLVQSVVGRRLEEAGLSGSKVMPGSFQALCFPLGHEGREDTAVRSGVVHGGSARSRGAVDAPRGGATSDAGSGGGTEGPGGREDWGG